MAASRMNANRTMNSTLRDRGLKLLGLRVVDIINILFPRNGTNSHQGKLIRTEFFGFWEQLSSSTSDQDNISKFYNRLLDEIKAWFKSKDKTAWNSTIPIHTIINTIAFMTISAPFRINTDSIVKFCEEYNHPSRASAKYQDPLALRNLVRLLSVRANLDKSDDYLSPLILGASSLLPSTRLVEITKLSTLEESDIQSNEYGFLFSYLLELIQSRGIDFQLATIQSILDRLNTVLQQCKINQLSAESTYMALSLLLSVFIQQDAITSVSFLRRCILVLTPFYYWAQPYGGMTRRLINSLQHELLSPGYNHRLALLRECNVVDYSGPGCERKPGYRFAKPLFYLYDSDDTSCGSLLNLIDTTLYKSEYMVKPMPSDADPTGGAIPPIGILALSILQILSVDLELTHQDLKYIQTLNQTQLFTFFQRLHRLELVIRNRPPSEQGREHRRIELQQIKDDIINLAQSQVNITGNVNLVPLFHLPPSTNDFTHLYSPPAPHIEHLRVPLTLTQRYDDRYPCQQILERLLEIIRAYSTHSDSSTLGGAKSPYISPMTTPNLSALNRKASIPNLGNLPPPPPPPPPPPSSTSSSKSTSSSATVATSKQQLQNVLTNPVNVEIIQSYKQLFASSSSSLSHKEGGDNSDLPGTVGTPSSGYSGREIRFVIVGNDHLLQHITHAYYILHTEYSELLQDLSIKWYIAPFTRNHLAGFLARHDLWYQRHIFTTFRSPEPLLVPWLRDSETDLRSNNENTPCFPTVFLRQSVEQYAQYGQQSCNLRVYTVEGYRDPNFTKIPDEVIPFVQRVEVGFRVTVEEHYRQQFGKTSGHGGSVNNSIPMDDKYLKTIDDMLQSSKSNTIAFNPVELCINYSKIDLTGKEQPRVIDDTIPYQTVVISNVPRKSDQSHPSDPLSPGLELYVQPYDKVKAQDKQRNLPDRLKTRNTLVSDPKQRISEATLISSTARFKILVDGVVYGPFATIRISTAYTKHQKPNSAESGDSTSTSAESSEENSENSTPESLVGAKDEPGVNSRLISPSMSVSPTSTSAAANDDQQAPEVSLSRGIVNPDDFEADANNNGGDKSAQLPRKQSNAVSRSKQSTTSNSTVDLGAGAKNPAMILLNTNEDDKFIKTPFIFPVQTFLPIITNSYVPSDNP